MRTLEVFTIQISKHRILNGTDIYFIDTSLKSGEKLFAPSPEILWGYKAGHLSTREYYTRYMRLIRDRFRRNPEPFLELLNMGKIALACYCRADQFCHRLILRNILERLCIREGIEFYYGGELVR